MENAGDPREKYIMVMVGAAMADLASKRIARQCGLTVDVNAGGAFGLFRGHPAVVTAAALAVLAVLLWTIFRRGGPKPLSRFGLALAAGGAAANLIERLAFGVVSDWIYLPFSTLVFRSGLRFNLADVEIGVGALIFLAVLFPGEKQAA